MRIYPRSTEGQSQKEFGLKANAIKTIRLALDTARNDEIVEIGGTLLWCFNASSLSASITVKFGDMSSSSDGLTFKQASMIRGLEFSNIIVTHTAQAGEWVDLVYMVEDGSISIENFASNFTSVTLSKPTTFDSVADISIAATTTVLLDAADSTRKELIITNLSTNAEVHRIGDSGAAAANGTPLSPGQTLILETTDAVYSYNPGAGAESLAVTMTKD